MASGSHPKFGEENGEDSTVTVQSFNPGSFFADRYQVENVLGTGAMGKVFACIDVPTGRRVALKVLHKERLGEAETLERFRREAEVLASIGHRCIVQVHAFHHTPDGTPYLAMELLEGVTLKRRLQAGGRFNSPQDLQEIVDCICSALGAAHARGVVHRDMKPDNVFLPASGDPRAKLVDFGLSRLADAKKVTHSGMLLGTPRYMAPEQLRSAADADARGDIYSVGVMIFEALTGESPYPAQDYGQLLGCLIEGRVRQLEELRPDLPHALGDVIRKAMAPDPIGRYSTTAQLAEAYGGAIGSPSRHAQYATPMPGQAMPSQPAAARPRRISLQNQGAVSQSTLALDLSAMSLGDMPSAYPLTPGPAPLPPSPNFAAHASTLPAQQLIAPEKAQEISQRVAVGTFSHGSPVPQGHVPAQAPVHDGSTVFLAGGPQSAMPMSPASVRPQPSQPAKIPSHAPPPPASFTGATEPPAKKSRGWLWFVIAMFFVVVLGAAGGLGLRAYKRGELELPDWAQRR